MKARLGRLLQDLGASLWFIPAILSLLGIALGLGMVELDRRLEPLSSPLAGMLFEGGPEGARAILSALASSMMTVTGVTFSVTVVALTLASQQYTPRVLRHFAADHGNQLVLGTFIATFVYSVLVLRTVRSDGSGEFVPHLAVTGGVVLSVTSLAMLIFFIHHAAAMIQPSSIISTISASAHRLIDDLFPEDLGKDLLPDEDPLDRFREPDGEPAEIPSGEEGYLQAIDSERLMKVAVEQDLLLRLERRIGEYVPRGSIIATAWPRSKTPPDLDRCLNRCFAFGRDRTMEQDPEYSVLQLSDIGVKALSPGINDPTTATTCVEFLGSILRHLGSREIPSPYRKGPDGELRVIARGPDFERMADLAFSQIRLYGEKDPQVMLALLREIRDIAHVVRSAPSRRAVLLRHVEEIAAGAARGITSAAKREQIERDLKRTWEALDPASRTLTPKSVDWRAA